MPATGQVIVESNSIYAKNLKGLGIGNGWVDPYLQYAAYGEVYTYIGAFISAACHGRVYSGTSLIQTPLGQKKVSSL